MGAPGDLGRSQVQTHLLSQHFPMTLLVFTGSWETGQDSQMPSLSTKHRAPEVSGLPVGTHVERGTSLESRVWGSDFC